MPRILLVDGATDIHDLVQKALPNDGYELWGVFDGYQALRALSEQTIDLILLDIDRALSGLEDLMAACQSAPRPVPIIALSNQEDAMALCQADARGIQACIPKPFNFQKLQKCMGELLQPKNAPVLVIDDIPNVSKRLGELLMEPFEAEAALDTVQAANACQTQPYRAIFIDVELPNATPVWLQQLRAVQPDARVYAMPKRDPNDNPDRYQQAGFDGILAKPFIVMELQTILAGLLKREEILECTDNVIVLSDAAAIATSLPGAEVDIVMFLLEALDTVADACYADVVIDMQALMADEPSLELLKAATEKCTEMALPIHVVLGAEFKKAIKKNAAYKHLSVFESVEEAQKAG